ncbi:thyroid receptor-interacting protein 11-like isoform X2 [Agrilus planipennis]|uniref:Thyroid receptor-interacting protein 11-like isoform X2 n=1 Tax=Agrilus planipennis TaxID=224129 RepID=A0A1W4XTH6_AGRPL|nr:thyroid receptor-interacting protein 11-like isoform X2 [Agrilus planipennis]
MCVCYCFFLLKTFFLKRDLKNHTTSEQNGNKEMDEWDWQGTEIPLTLDPCLKYQEEIDNLKKKVDILENDKEDLTKSMEQLDADSQQTINKLLNLKESLQTEFNTLKNDYNDLKKEYGDVMKENLEKSQKIEQLLNQKNTIHDDHQLLKVVEEYERLKSSFDEQNEHKAILIVENHKLKEENEKLYEKLEQISLKIEELESEARKTETILDKNEDNNSLGEKENSHIIAKDLENALHDRYKSILEDFRKNYIDNDYLTTNHHSSNVNVSPEDEFSQELNSVLKYLLSFKSKAENLEEKLQTLTQEKTAIIQSKNMEIEKLLKNSEILSQEVITKTQTIKDYEKECAQLMENNDMLITELENFKNSSGLQTISETHEDNILLLENQLENANKKIEELKLVISDLENSRQECNEETETELLYVKKHLNLTGQELSQAKEENQELLANLRQSEEERDKWHDEYIKLKNLHQTCDEEKLKLRSMVEKLTADYENLEYSLTENNVSTESLTEEIEDYKKKFDDSSSKLHQYEEELKQATQKINDYEDRIQELNSHTKNLESLNFSLESNLNQFQVEIDSLREEMLEKIKNDDKYQAQIRNLTEKLQNAKMSETSLKLQYDTLYKELLSIKELKQRLESENATLTKQVDDLNTLNEELTQKLIVQTEEMKIVDLNGSADSNQTKKSEEEIVQLQEKLLNVQKLNEDLLQKQSILETQNAELTKAKNELIEFVQTKHQENIQYHNEIQRLNQVLITECANRQSLEVEINNLKELLKEKESSTNRPTEDENLTLLKDKLACMEEEKLRFGEEITKMSEELRKKNEEITQKEENLKILADKNKNLCEKCEFLAENLLQEQSNHQKVLAEYTSPSEREQSLVKELERLREHLVEMEESYTQELLLAEQKNQEMLVKVNEIEQREKQSSSVYTSINIRANQQVETMQVQLQLVTNQRDELRKKLSDVEDQLNKQNAAVTNLQLVIEQFQKEKEKDIYVETERIRRQIKAEKQIQDELKQEIANLKSQLEGSKQGLQAASRLNDQLETCKQQIASYKDKVRELQEKLVQAEEKFKDLSSNTDVKVDKNLIKSLLIGFITSSHNTKDQNQILKIIATVLDFNQQESEKVKLNQIHHEGWLNSLLHPQNAKVNNDESKESLSQAFVRFLEAESKPTVIPNLLSSTITTKSTGDSSKSSSKRQSPILLSEVVLPTFADFGQSRSSSSILKDVLKDNS